MSAHRCALNARTGGVGPLSEQFTYDALPGRVVFGPGSSREHLLPEVERLGATRLLLVSTEQEGELAAGVASAIGDRVAGHFRGVRPHVPVAVAEAAREQARAAGADALLSIGGGSTTGTAKAVALETGLPIVAVPTTYAGSEMTPVWGMTEAARKTTGRAPQVMPKVVLYDPDLTLSLPPAVTGPSAMNALAHCVDAFYTPAANPITSLMAEEGAAALARSVPAAVRDGADRDARADLLYGAYLAGAAFAAAGGGLHHMICHVLGGAFDLPHAETHTIVLPQVAAFNAAAVPAVMARVARAIGADHAPGGLFDLATSIGAPTALRDVGLRAEDVDDAVALVLERGAPSNPRPLDEAGVRAILQGAYEGARPNP